MKPKKALIKTAAGYDLLNSLTKAAPCAFLCALSLSFCFFFSTLDVLSSQKINYLMFFGRSSESVLTFTQYALVAAGLAAALLLFRFLGSVPQTNVLLSSGISRQRIFWNRVFAGASTLFLGVFLPLTATLFLNVRAYGLKSYILKPYLLFLLSALALVFIGFCLGLLGSVLAGSTAEAAAAALILPSFPFVLCSFFTYCISIFLKGYLPLSEWSHTAFYSKTYFLSPWHLISMTQQKLGPTGGIKYTVNVNIWENFSKINAMTGTQPQNPYTALKIPSSLLFIFAAWIAAMGLLVLLSYSLFLRRKAENNSHPRSSKGIAVLLSSFFTVGAATLGLYFWISRMTTAGSYLFYFGGSIGVKALCWLSLLLPGALVLLVCLAIYAGNLKKLRALLKALPFCLLLLVVPLIFVFGGFGYVSHIPKAADVKSVGVSGSLLPGALSELTRNMGCFESENDIRRVIDIHEKAVSRGKEYPVYFKITYTLKDGGELTRTYFAVNAEANTAIGGLFESDVFRTYFLNQIGDKSAWHSAEGLAALIDGKSTWGPYPQEISWLRFGGASLSLNAGTLASDGIALNTLLTEESFDRLLSCYASDLTSLSAAAFLTPSRPPVYVLSFTIEDSCVYTPDGEETPQKQHYDLYVTADMTQTLAFLNGLGVTLSAPQKVVKEITLYACGNAGLLEPERQFSDHPISEQLGKLVKTVTDPAQINEMAAKLYPYYLSDGRNVQYACVVYDDGSSEYYLLKN